MRGRLRVLQRLQTNHEGDAGGIAVEASAPTPLDAGPDTAGPRVYARCTTARPPSSPLSVDGGPAVLADGGASFFTKHPPPIVTSSGGPVLKTPRIVPIFFADDPLADDLERFVMTVGCTDYWREAVGEYGVGDATRRWASSGTEREESDHWSPSTLGVTERASSTNASHKSTANLDTLPEWCRHRASAYC